MSNVPWHHGSQHSIIYICIYLPYVSLFFFARPFLHHLYDYSHIYLMPKMRWKTSLKISCSLSLSHSLSLYMITRRLPNEGVMMEWERNIYQNTIYIKCLLACYYVIIIVMLAYMRRNNIDRSILRSKELQNQFWHLFLINIFNYAELV